MNVDDLADRIAAVAARRTTKLIAIDGWGGAGKSRLAAELEKGLQSLTVVHMTGVATSLVRGKTSRPAGLSCA